MNKAKLIRALRQLLKTNGVDPELVSRVKWADVDLVTGAFTIDGGAEIVPSPELAPHIINRAIIQKANYAKTWHWGT
jgi:hypothetical protein